MRFLSLLLVVLCAAAACNGAPTSFEVERQVTLRNFPTDVDVYGWGDYMEQISAAISNVIETAKETGADLWQGLQDAGNQIIQKAKDSLVSSEDAATVFLTQVYPKLIEKLSVAVDFGKDELQFIGDLVVSFLKDFGQEAIRLGIKYFEEHQDEIIKEIQTEAKVFLRVYVLKKLKDLYVGSLKRDVATTFGWTDFWGKVGKAINNAFDKVKATGEKLADKISEEFDELKEQINQIVAPVKAKVVVVMEKIMPVLAAKAKFIFKDAKRLAKEVGSATLELLKKLGHDSLVEAQNWLDENHEMVEKLLFKFLTEQLPKMIKDSIAGTNDVARTFNGWTDFWEKVGEKIDNAVEKVKETGKDLADKISQEFDDIKDKVNSIIAPIKVKVQIILRDVMPVIAAKAKIVFHDAQELAKQVGGATLELLKKLGHDALVEAKKWLEQNHEMVEKLLFKFLTEQLPKMIMDSVKSYSVTQYNGWTDFWEKVGNAIDNAVDKVKETGENLADKISEEFNELKDKMNAIIAPVKAKVQIILRDVMPKIAAKAKIIIHDARVLAKQVGAATLEILKKLGHDALVEAQKWLEQNHELVEKLLYQFLTEQLPKLIMDSIKSNNVQSYNGWTDFWEKVGEKIDNAVEKVKETGKDLAEKISEEFDEIKDKINSIIAPIKVKVQIILRDVMPVIAAKAKIVFHDAQELAKQVGGATLELLKKLGHDALVEAKKWLEQNHEMVEKLLFKFLTEQLPKMIMDSMKSYSVTQYNGWTDFWEKIGNAIDNAVDKVKETGENLADKISEEFNEIKDKMNAIVAPIKAKVQIILRDVMPKIAAKAKIFIHDAGELAKQVGKATLEILKKLGHDALIEAQKWLSENNELVEELLFKFLTEQLPKLIKDSLASAYAITPYNGWTDFWEKVVNAIDNAVEKAKETGKNLADKISEEFDEIKEKVNAIIAPIKEKVKIIMQEVMPVIAAKAKIVFHDAQELAKQVGKAILEILKKLGHDALVEGQKWLEENHELVEKLLFKFLTEQLPKMIMESVSSYSVTAYGWTDFWEKVGNAIDNAVDKVKATGEKLADKISEEFNELKDKINAIVAPVKTKVVMVLRDIMPKIAEKAKIVIKDAKELAKQVGTATLAILKKLGHDALIEAQKWLSENQELVEKLLFQFLTEQLPKLIQDGLTSTYSLTTTYGWTDFWEKVGNAIDNAVSKAKETGKNLAEKISNEFDELKDKINAIVAPIKTKVVIIMEDLMPKIAAKVKLIIKDAKVVAEQVGLATLSILKKLGHDALLHAQKWLAENKDVVEKLIFEFLTEKLPQIIKEASLSF